MWEERIQVEVLNCPEILSRFSSKPYASRKIPSMTLYGTLGGYYELGEFASKLPSTVKVGVLKADFCEIPPEVALTCGVPPVGYYKVSGEVLIALPISDWEMYRGMRVTVKGFRTKYNASGCALRFTNGTFVGALVWVKDGDQWRISPNYIESGWTLPSDLQGNPNSAFLKEYDTSYVKPMKAVPPSATPIEYNTLSPESKEETSKSTVFCPEIRIPFTDKLGNELESKIERIPFLNKLPCLLPLLPTFHQSSPAFLSRYRKWLMENGYKDNTDTQWEFMLGSKNIYSFKAVFLRAMVKPSDELLTLLNQLATLEMYNTSPDRGTLVKKFGRLPEVSIPEPLRGMDVPEINPVPPYKCQFLTKVGDKYISNTLLKLEISLFGNLIGLASIPTGISDTDVKRVLEEFQAEKGFNLTDEQAAGVGLVKYGSAVLSGCAGSGKTTTAECMTRILEEGGWTVLYACPTGKASKRLSEVVGREVKTIHSFFKLPVGSPLPISEEGYDNLLGSVDLPDKTALIFDEMAMCDTVLLALAVLKSLDKEVAMYFLGDIKQLPPIGRGMPYRDLMGILPCVELGVSKRSAEGSSVNYNCGELVKGSANFKEDENFVMMRCRDENIPATVLDAVELLKKEYPVEDIQVVSPYATPKIPWGNSNLNPILQDVLNPGGEFLFKVGSVSYRRGDRVVITRNTPDIRRYKLVGREFTQCGEGIVNGDVGTILDIVLVQDYVWDSTVLSEVAVLVEIDDDIVAFEGKLGVDSFYGDWCCDLAYSLSVHKSQGSQYKGIIFMVGERDGVFVNRNMIYTAISRSQEKVIVVGAVDRIETLIRNKVDGSDCATMVHSLGREYTV